MGPIPLDPHEKVSMDAEKNHVEDMGFLIYGEKNVKKTCSNDGIPYYTPWLLKTIYAYSLETIKKIIIVRAYYFNCTLPKWGAFFNRF